MGQEVGILENDLKVRARDGAMLPAFLAEPPGVEDAPLIVVAPEFFGLTPWVRSATRGLAREGFRAVAVEIFARDPLPEGATIGQVRDRMGRLSVPGAVSDLRCALDHVEVSGEKLGAIGFCMGGMLSLLLAADGRRLDGAVSCYGSLRHAGPPDASRPESALDAIGRALCPVLGVYGRKDSSIPLADVNELQSRLGNRGEVALYDAGHAFLNDTRRELYEPAQAALAWAKIFGFFRRTLT